MVLLTQLFTCTKNSKFLVKNTTTNLGEYKVFLIFLYSIILNFFYNKKNDKYFKFI